MDNEVDSYGSIGFITIRYRNNNGYRGANYFMATNNIDSCCNAISDNLRDNIRRPAINSRIRNKSNEIIILIRRLLIEAMETGRLNLTNMED